MGDLRVRFPKPCDETWDAMAPAGCDRLCARCDTKVVDLSARTIEDVELLLRADSQSCVRARIGADGVVALKPSRTMRRMLAVGLLTVGAPAFAGPRAPQGSIAGKVDWTISTDKVMATGVDGRIYHARVKPDGRYRIQHVPPGTYKLTFTPGCEKSWTVDNVVVTEGEALVADTKDPAECIIVGALRIDDHRG